MGTVGEATYSEAKSNHIIRADNMSETETFNFPVVTVAELEGILHTMMRIEFEDVKNNGKTDEKGKKFETRIPAPVLALGKAGIGKTEMFRGLAKELGIGFKEIRLVNYTETDLVGLPYKNEDNMTSHAANDLFPIAERDGDKGILLVDEFTSATRQVQVPILQLTDVSRSIGSYHLPDGWKIIIAGNGPSDGGTFNDLPGTVISRSSCYYVVPAADAWLDWAATHNIHPYVRAYVSRTPSAIHGYVADQDYDRAFPCPRAWTNLSRELYDYDRAVAANNGSNMPSVITCLVASYVGRKTAVDFLDFISYRSQMVDAQRILKEGEKCATHIYDLNANALWLTLGFLAEDVKNLVSEACLRAYAELPESQHGDSVAIFEKAKLAPYLVNAFRWITAKADKSSASNVADIVAWGITSLVGHNSLVNQFATSKYMRDPKTGCPAVIEWLSFSSSVMSKVGE